MPFQPLKIVIFLFLSCLLPFNVQGTQDERPQLFNLKIIPLDQGVQLVATITARPDYRLMLLDAPTRLVVDLDGIDLAQFVDPAAENKVGKQKFIRNVHYGFDGINSTRIIIETQTPFKIDNILVDPLHDAIWQLIIDLKPTSDHDFAEKMAQTRQNLPPKTTRNVSESTEQNNDLSRPFTIVLDAGHGGFDVGAEGVNGTWEKDITLAFARELRASLAQINPDFATYLTREEDVFLRLSERMRRARDFHADLFVSIHADSIHLANVRGATIYTISDKASDALAKAIAEKENKADLLDGLPPDEPPAVVDILLDLTRRETDSLSTIFADKLIDHLNQAGIRLIKPSHRYAGFMVLRAPEIPSVLIELGYLSNAQDEKLIADPVWRGHVANTIAQAIGEYALDHAPHKP